VARLAHGLASLIQALRDFDAVAAQTLDDLVEPVAQILLVARERVWIERALPKLALAGLSAWLTLLAWLSTLLALLPALALLALLAALSALRLLLLVALGAERAVELLTLPSHQVGQALDGLVLRV